MGESVIGDRTEALSDAGSDRDRLRLTVSSRRPVSSTIVEFELRGEGDLPGWEPGAHLAVEVPGVGERQYSLCGDPADRTTYRIAVRRDEEGRGGSRWMHDELAVGEVVLARPPRNNFHLPAASEYRFIAAGVGITPLLPMVRAAARSGVPWRLVYTGRSRASMAYLEEIEALGPEVHVHVTEGVGRLDVGVDVRDAPPGAVVVACGPAGLLEELEQIPTQGELHVERFTVRELGDDVAPATSFEVELAASGAVVEVGPEESILSALEREGFDVPYSCREGTCGTCEAIILEGEGDHRDSILSAAEQAANDVIMICVSRCRGRRIVLDL